MSESDDTDELLLIPSQVTDTHIFENNFVPYYQIVDKLITQVSKLKSRINSIEHSSDVSLGSANNSIDTLLNMHGSDSNSTCRRCYSFESLPQSSDYRRSTLPQCFSTQSTPQKPRSKLMLKSFPNSPKCNIERTARKPLHRAGVPKTRIAEGDRLFEDVMPRQPLAQENHIIQDIDNFLCTVKPFIRTDAARALDFDKYSHGYLEKQSRPLLDIEQILKEMDKQEEKIKNMHEEGKDKVENSDKLVEKNEEVVNPIDWKYFGKNGIDTLSMTSTDSSLADRSTVLCRPVSKKNELGNHYSNDNRVKIHNEKNSELEEFRYNSRSERNITEHGDCLITRASTSDLKRSTVDPSSSSNLTKKSLSAPQVDIHSNAKDALSLHRKLLSETNSPEFNSHYDHCRKLMMPGGDPHLGNVSLVNLWSKGNNEAEKSSDKCIQKLQEEKLRRTHCEELIQQLQNKILEQQEKLAVAIQVDEAKDTAIIRFHDAWERASMKFKLVAKEKDQLENDLAKLASHNKRVAEEWEERIEFHRKETNEALNSAKEHQNKWQDLEKKIGELSAENETLKASNVGLENKIQSEEDKNKQLSNILANKEIELNESKNILTHAKKEVAQCQGAVEMCQRDFATIKAEYDLIQEEIRVERMNVAQLHEQNKSLHEEMEIHRQKETTLVEGLKEAQVKLDSNKKELRNFYQGQVELLVQTKLKEFQKQLDDAEYKMKEELGKKELEIAKSAAIHIQQINDKYSLELNLIEQKHQEEMQLKQVKIAQLEQRLHDFQMKLDRQQEKRADLVKQLQKVMEAQWNEALRIINNGKSPVPQDDSSSTIDQLQSLHSKSYQNMEALLSQEFDVKTRNQHHHTNGHDLHNGKNSQKEGDNINYRTPKSKFTKSQDDSNLQRYINLLLRKQPGNPTESNGKLDPVKCADEHESVDRWQHSDFPLCNALGFHELPQKQSNKKKNLWN